MTKPSDISRGRALRVEVEQLVAWQKSPDEALQSAITTLFPDASDDAQAQLYSMICDKIGWQTEKWNDQVLTLAVERCIG